MFKKILSVILAAGMCLSMASCGKDEQQVSEYVDDMSQPYELDYYMITGTMSESDVLGVQDALNKYLKEKINSTIKIHALDWTSFTQRVDLMLQSGEKFDVFWVGGTAFTNYAAKGGILPLDDLIKENAPELVDAVDPLLWEGSKYNGQNYAVPVNKEVASNFGFVYRKDITDKLGIDMSQVTSYETLIPVMDKVRAANPDLPLMNLSAGGLPTDEIGFDYVSGLYGNYFGSEDGEIKMVAETEEFKKAVELTQYLDKNGYLFNEQGKTQVELMKTGSFFVTGMNLKPGKANEINQTLIVDDVEWAQVDTTEPRTYTADCVGSMHAVSATSKNPARAVKFLSLLNTDKYVNNLLNFGLEGEDYDMVGENTIKLNKDGRFYDPGWAWMRGNNFLHYLTIEEDPDKHEQYKAYNEKAVPSAMLGFIFDPELVKNEFAAVTSVQGELYDLYRTGKKDASEIPQFVEKIKQAGGDKVKAEIQRQYDEWRKANNK